MNALSRIPYVSLLLAVAALTIHALPGAAERLQYDRAAIAAGELWRILSGHWTHVSADHLLWNFLAFTLLAIIFERCNRLRFCVCITTSAALISLALWTTLPHLPIYRGLSGIASALFGFGVVTLLRKEISACRWSAVWVLSAVCLALVAKIAYELATASTIFVRTAGPHVLPLTLPHSAGVTLGFVVGLTPSYTRQAVASRGAVDRLRIRRAASNEIHPLVAQQRPAASHRCWSRRMLSLALGRWEWR